MVTAILIAWSVGLSMTRKCRPEAQFHIGSVAVVRALPSSLQKQQQTNKNHNKTTKKHTTVRNTEIDANDQFLLHSAVWNVAST